MKRIWKFPFAIESPIEIEMPKGAEILSVQSQFNEPMMWALVDPLKEKETRRFQIFGSGHDVPDVGEFSERNYIATFQVDDGNYVFHLFELKVS